MDTKYIINQLCTVNQKNPTPSKNMEIAINIEPVRLPDKFENFVLGIDDWVNCCEFFGAETNMPEGEYFINSIEVNVDMPKEVHDEVEKNTPEYILEEVAYDDEFFIVRINTDKGEYYAWVYNIHNGYYSHLIYWTNSELKIDVYSVDSI